MRHLKVAPSKQPQSVLAAEWVPELVLQRLVEQLPEEQVLGKVASLALLRRQHLQPHGPSKSAKPLPQEEAHERLSGRPLLELW